MSQDSVYWRNLETVTGSESAQRESLDLRVPGLTILAHPDVGRVGERAVLTGLASGREVPLSRLEPLFSPPGEAGRRPLADPHLSRRPVLLAPAHGGAVAVAANGSRTRVAVDGVAVAERRELTPAEVERGAVLLLARRIALLLHPLDPAPPPEVPGFGLIGESAGMVAVRRQIARVADLDVPALLRGETGTGKELAAGAIHRASRRREKPFIAVNMGAVPPSLAAAELFGAKKGAFTGADRPRSGYFRRAQEGTLFLDEIGETPPEVQVLLLRALESGEIEPLGADTPRRVDVRILAATDAQLEAEIEAGRFRAPLLHRLSGYEIRLPPLRERRDDLGRLLVHFLRQELETLGEGGRLDDPEALKRPYLPATVVARLALYAWPGNVRQLRNLARRLVIENRGEPQLVLTPEIEALLEAPAASPRAPRAEAPAAREAKPAASPSEPAPRPVYRSPDEVSEEELLEALRANGFRIQPTAAALNVSRTSLYALIDRSPRVRKAKDLTREEIERCRERHGGDLDAMAAALEVSRKGLRRQMTALGL